MWSFDTKEGRCKKILFDGCDPTENLFETEEQCVERCGGEESDELDAPAGPDATGKQ